MSQPTTCTPKQFNINKIQIVCLAIFSYHCLIFVTGDTCI